MRGYQMTLLSTNLDDIHAFQTPTECGPPIGVPPKALEKLPPEGCANLAWHNKKYSMLCFSTGKNSDGKTKELFLLVAERADLQDAPASEKPQFLRVHDNLITTASWTRGKNVYVLLGNREPDLSQHLDRTRGAQAPLGEERGSANRSINVFSFAPRCGPK